MFWNKKKKESTYYSGSNGTKQEQKFSGAKEDEDE